MKTKKEIIKYLKKLDEKLFDEDGEVSPTVYLSVAEEYESMALEWVLETNPDIRDIGRRIVCAAIRFSDGDVVVGPRHFCPTMREQLSHIDDKSRPEEGFIDQHGVYLSREEAWAVADEAGQIIRRCGGDENKLYSENLY